MYRYNYPMRNSSNFGYQRRGSYGNDRLFGGFAIPFLLGGITGAAVSRPNYYYPPYPTYYANNFYYPYPPYGPYPYPYY